MAWEAVTPHSLGPCQGALELVFLLALPGSQLPRCSVNSHLPFLAGKRIKLAGQEN